MLRGASWHNYDRGNLLSSYRIHNVPGYRVSTYGFRCVLAPSASTPDGACHRHEGRAVCEHAGNEIRARANRERAKCRAAGALQRVGHTGAGLRGLCGREEGGRFLDETAEGRRASDSSPLSWTAALTWTSASTFPRTSPVRLAPFLGPRSPHTSERAPLLADAHSFAL